MTDLIARLEQATGPSRELDAEIWKVANPAQYEHQCSFRGSVYAGMRFSKAEKAAWIMRAAMHYAPHFTSSIDAALTLVPEGWRWRISTDDNASFPQAAHAEVMSAPWPSLINGDILKDGHAATPALALCIAALRARDA